LTIAQHYLDWRSFMRSDGSEVLYGEDWDARVADLRRRSGGQCEQQLEVTTKWMEGDLVKTSLARMERCRCEAADPHHIIRRSVRRDDRLSNLQALCRYHHDLLDERKVRSDRKENRESA